MRLRVTIGRIWFKGLPALHVLALCTFALVLLLRPEAVAAEKVREWQTGKVLDSQRNRYFVGTMGTATTFALYKVYETFLIEGDTYAYVAQERIHGKRSKTANLTINGPVKYAVENRRVFVIDDDYRVHEMEIVKKILRQPTGPVGPQP